GKARLLLKKPKIFKMGMQIMVPRFGRLIRLAINCLTISTPLISSPWMPAENRIVGPGVLERSIIIGISIFVAVWSLAILKLISREAPNGISSPKMVIVFLFSCSMNKVKRYVQYIL